MVTVRSSMLSDPVTLQTFRNHLLGTLARHASELEHTRKVRDALAAELIDSMPKSTKALEIVEGMVANLVSLGEARQWIYYTASGGTQKQRDKQVADAFAELRRAWEKVGSRVRVSFIKEKTKVRTRFQVLIEVI